MKQVLFFGRENCEASQGIFDRLIELGFDVTYVESKKRAERLPKVALNWDGDYILSYRSLFILPESLIKKAKIAAVNFHPGSPEYPGSGCINFALYDGSDQFGVTAHLIDAEVDSGKILECKRFEVFDHDTLDTLLSRTHDELNELCMGFIKNLAKSGDAFIHDRLEKSKNEKWRGKARKIKELDALQQIKPDIEKEELERIIRATYTKLYPPRITLHGYEFVLSDNQKKV